MEITNDESLLVLKDAPSSPLGVEAYAFRRNPQQEFISTQEQPGLTESQRFNIVDRLYELPHEELVQIMEAGWREYILQNHDVARIVGSISNNGYNPITFNPPLVKELRKIEGSFIDVFGGGSALASMDMFNGYMSTRIDFDEHVRYGILEVFSDKYTDEYRSTSNLRDGTMQVLSSIPHESVHFSLNPELRDTYEANVQQMAETGNFANAIGKDKSVILLQEVLADLAQSEITGVTMRSKYALLSYLPSKKYNEIISRFNQQLQEQGIKKGKEEARNLMRYVCDNDETAQELYNFRTELMTYRAKGYNPITFGKALNKRVNEVVIENGLNNISMQDILKLAQAVALTLEPELSVFERIEDDTFAKNRVALQRCVATAYQEHVGVNTITDKKAEIESKALATEALLFPEIALESERINLVEILKVEGENGKDTDLNTFKLTFLSEYGRFKNAPLFNVFYAISNRLGLKPKSIVNEFTKRLNLLNKSDFETFRSSLKDYLTYIDKLRTINAIENFELKKEEILF